MCIRDRLYAVHAQTPGNPENWCRNGLFPEDSKEFKIGTVKAIASKSKRTYFFNDYETAVSYTHLRAHETVLDIVCRLLLEKKNTIVYYTQATHKN